MSGSRELRPSRTHPNRQPFNRLVYDLADEALDGVADRLHGTVLDLGCGSAPYRDYIAAIADRYIGVDWSASFHDVAADVIADLNSTLPFRDGAADTVFCLSVLEHLRQPEAMLREAARVLRSGGSIVLIVPFMWQVHEAPHDYYRFTRYGLEDLFGRAGFAAVEVREISGFWATWVLKFNYQSLKLIRGPRPLRAAARLALSVVWRLDQAAARALDRRWHAPEETQSYLVTAVRP